MDKEYSKTADLIIISVFLFIQLFLYSYIHLWAIWLPRYACFLSVLLCFAFAFIYIKRTRHNYLICSALFFTVISDFFLVLLNSFKFTAMIFFNMAQIFYLIYTLFLASGKTERTVNIISRIALAVVMEIITALYLKESYDILIAISVFYFSNLIMNFVYCAIHFKTCKYLAIGLLLFIMCDVCIAVETVNTIMGVGFFKGIDLIWLFYLPSQTLIALSLPRLHINPNITEPELT